MRIALHRNATTTPAARVKSKIAMHAGLGDARLPGHRALQCVEPSSA
jgi:hypothetical protein